MTWKKSDWPRRAGPTTKQDGHMKDTKPDRTRHKWVTRPIGGDLTYPDKKRMNFSMKSLPSKTHESTVCGGHSRREKTGNSSELQKPENVQLSDAFFCKTWKTPKTRFSLDQAVV